MITKRVLQVCLLIGWNIGYGTANHLRTQRAESFHQDCSAPKVAGAVNDHDAAAPHFAMPTLVGTLLPQVQGCKDVVDILIFRRRGRGVLISPLVDRSSDIWFPAVVAERRAGCLLTGVATRREGVVDSVLGAGGERPGRGSAGRTV
jgi:hypothetical protein